eukprot:TRINITY_DN1922_c0_g1_i2.p1 TRINITY_DN1922_c0_g1~~TRINITY_DN1922_c0_g1_i2.p1  ORF type:complete len:497 (+),score=150.87 TRINITY_DN1922_c0_g1_i2:134-1624(+)
MGCGSSSKPANRGDQQQGGKDNAAAKDSGGGGKGKATAAPPKPAPTVEDDDSELDTDEEDSDCGNGLTSSGSGMGQRRASKSVEKLQELSKEREKEDDGEGEMFLWGDFAVDVKEAVKKTTAPKRNPRQPPKPKPKRDGPPSNAPDGMFMFGDFAVSMTAGDDELLPSGEAARPHTLDTRPVKELHQYKLRNYSQYSLIGHPTRVKCVCVAPNEGAFISCSNEDAAMTMSNIHNGKEIMSFMGHEDTIISACFSVDAKYLATTSRDNTLILWDVTTGKQILTFEHEKVVICCGFSKDSKYLVSGCQDKVCRVWETKKGRELISFMEHEGIIISVSFSPDGQTVVSASADKSLRVWKTSDASCQHVLRGHTGIVLSCTFRSDGKYIVSNDEKTLRIWDAAAGTNTLCLNVDDVPRANPMVGKKQTWTLSSYCPGKLGFYIIAACNSRTVHVFHPETGQEVLVLHTKAPVYCLSCGTETKVAFGDSYGNIFIVDLWPS